MEWVCEEFPILREDGAVIGIGLHRISELVRCKDCKHYKDGFCYNPNTYDDEKTKGNTVPDWFCADGKRR